MPANYKVTNEYRVFYVVFQSSNFNRFWAGFTAEGFQHVWTFWGKPIGEPGLLTPEWTIKFEPLAPHFDTDIWFMDPVDAVTSYINDPGVTDILKINLKFQTAEAFIPRGIITCVSAVKCAMGLRAWHILTPKQLYFYLLRKGATSLKGASPQ
uniref:Uncharacterized protein n=1 Tax=uncultured marine virus TaxID=186617 RepID=A0A0F7L7G1_9VIRU|nr:hypothetical protein [uncultured marine virus]